MKKEIKLEIICFIFIIIAVSFSTFVTVPEVSAEDFEYQKGEVIVCFRHTVDVSELETFEGHNITDKIVELNIALVEVNESEEENKVNEFNNNSNVFFADLNYIGEYHYTPNDRY